MATPVERLNAALEGLYRIESELGEGGMATVYLADDLKHERKVALKVLKPELAAVVGAERFLAEIKTTANLQHPHILPLHDSGEADGFLFYVMPYVEGESLREKLDREHQLPVDDAVQIAKNVAEALDYAHSQGVIHRDIKPANILLQAGKPVISDFGIALAVGAAGGGRLTETGLSLGTPHYMSPEQATGDLSVGAATDVYALGCVLYEMLVAEPPYTGGTPQAILGKIIAGKLASATEHRRSVPPNVDAAVRRALEKVPADRFRTAQDFAGALADPEFRHGATDPQVTSAAGRLWNPLSGALAASTLALGVALAWMVARPAELVPPSRFELVLPADLERLTGDRPTLAISPDGAIVALRGRRVGGQGSAVYLRRLDDLTPVPLDGTGGTSEARFSPDGDAIAYTTTNFAVAVASLGGAPTRIAVPEAAVPSRGLAWSPDGAWIYFQKAGQGLWRTGVDSGEQEEITTLTGNDDSHGFPEPLPNGRGLLFTRFRAERPEIALLSFESGEVRTLFDGTRARHAGSGHVVFLGRDGSLRAAPFDQDRMEVTGAVREVLTDIPGARSPTGNFDISRNGVLVYLPAPASLEIVPAWIGADGAAEALDPDIRGRYEAPALSPDGTRLAIEVVGPNDERDIWIYGMDDGTFAPLTSDGFARRPFWSSDGRRVGFVSTRDGASAVYATSSDFTGATVLIREASGSLMQEAHWTPDEGTLVFREGSAVAAVLYRAPAHPDSAATRLFEEQGTRPFAPKISPDGRWLAYTWRESGGGEVWVRPLRGGGARTQVSVDGGRETVWGPASDRLYYRGLAGSWVVASLSVTDDQVRVVDRRPLASTEGFVSPNTAHHFDVAPDGETILGLLLRDGGRGEAEDIVVQNFFEELKRLVPN